MTNRFVRGPLRATAALLTALTVAVASVGAAPTLAQSNGNGIVGPAQPGNDRASAAVAVSIGGGWQEFSFVSIGVPARGCFSADPTGPLCATGVNAQFVGPSPWTFTGAATLTVTDAFSSGDVFQIYDFSTVIGTTSTATSGADCSNNPDTCLANTSISHGTFNLGDGSHSITIVPIAMAPGSLGGVGFFRLTGGTTGGACTVTQTATKTGTTLNLTYTISTNATTTFTVFFVVGATAAPLITTTIPAITTPTTFTIPIPNFPSLGSIGVLTTVSGTGGIQCADFDLVTT